MEGISKDTGQTITVSFY